MGTFKPILGSGRALSLPAPRTKSRKTRQLLSPKSSRSLKPWRKKSTRSPRIEHEVEVPPVGKPIGVADEAAQVLVKIVEGAAGGLLRIGIPDGVPQIRLIQIVAQGHMQIGEMDKPQAFFPRPKAYGMEGRTEQPARLL